MTNEAREILRDARTGDRLELTLSDGRQLTGEIQDTQTTNHIGESRERGLDFVTGGGEFVYGVTVDLDYDHKRPSVTRTVFADVAADLGRIDEDEYEGPDEYVTLDEGDVLDAEPVESEESDDPNS